MAYGLLGGVPPVVGIYMAFFPVLVYTIFGTSRHVSMGTFAIVCLMTGKVVSQYTTIEHQQNGTIARLTQLDELHTTDYNNIQVASTVTFVVAMIQVCSPNRSSKYLICTFVVGHVCDAIGAGVHFVVGHFGGRFHHCCCLPRRLLAAEGHVRHPHTKTER